MKKNAKNIDSCVDNKSDSVDDSVVVVDNTGRRRFMRAGAAFVLAGSATAASNAQQESQFLVADCDGYGNGEEKNPEIAGNDSDSGAEADRVGCGRQDPPAISEYKPKKNRKTKVAKIIG